MTLTAYQQRDERVYDYCHQLCDNEQIHRMETQHQEKED